MNAMKKFLTSGVAAASMMAGGLAFCPVSSFAFDSVQEAPKAYIGQDSDFKDNKASTDLRFATDSSNISATLPVDVYMIAKVNGGDAITPTGNAYRIVNHSMLGLVVKKIDAEQGPTKGWQAVATDPSKEAKADIKGSIADFTMKINDYQVKDGETDLAKPWSIPAATDPAKDDAVLPLTITDVKTSMLTVQSSAYTPAYRLTYTIDVDRP
jgi:hypothetical protein